MLGAILKKKPPFWKITAGIYQFNYLQISSMMFGRQIKHTSENKIIQISFNKQSWKKCAIF